MIFWQVDAFTSEIFSGNPAAVFVFEREPSEILMQKIANEMNLSETAFVIREKGLKIRWFTPKAEVNLCGHATLAAAHILWQEKLIEGDSLCFESKSGELRVLKKDPGYTLDFPLQPGVEKEAYLDLVTEIMGVEPEYVGSNGEDCMAVLGNPALIYHYVPNPEKIGQLKERGFLLTARDPQGEFDYVYRAFFPKLNVLEDPVCGSANTCLAAYWAKTLGKKIMRARQVSERGGTLGIEVAQSRVYITGNAVTVFKGNLLQEIV